MAWRAAGATWLEAPVGSVSFRCGGFSRCASDRTTPPPRVSRRGREARVLTPDAELGLAARAPAAGPPRGQQRDAGPRFGSEGRCGAGGTRGTPSVGAGVGSPRGEARPHGWRRACSWPPVRLTRPAVSSFRSRRLQPGSAAPWGLSAWQGLPQGQPFISVCCQL